jgi:DNA repair photolyase
MRSRGLVQLCTTVGAWSPEAQEHDLGRRSLDAILSQPGWTVLILTKNAAVKRDLDIIERYSDRVLVGLSLTAAGDNSRITSAVEPNASSNAERMHVLEEAPGRSLRSYDRRPEWESRLKRGAMQEGGDWNDSLGDSQ